jgi:hypothetical protein
MPKRSAKNVAGREPETLHEALAACENFWSFTEGTIHQHRRPNLGRKKPNDEEEYAKERQDARDRLSVTHEAAQEYVQRLFDPDRCVVCRQLTSEQMSEPWPKAVAS